MFREKTEALLILAAFACFAVALVLAVLGWRSETTDVLSPEDATFRRLGRLADEAVKYYEVTGTWPTSAQPLLSLLTNKDMTNLFIDGWGREFVFRTHTNAPNTLWIISYGADGLPGGLGTNSDQVFPLP